MSTFVIAGGSGFLGTALVRALRGDGHDVTVLTRRPSRDGDSAWSPASNDTSWFPILDNADAIINLAGSSIGGGRWTKARKRDILESRTQATRALVRACERNGKAAGFLCADVKTGKRYLDWGFRVLAYGVDSGLFQGALKAGIDGLRGRQG